MHSKILAVALLALMLAGCGDVQDKWITPDGETARLKQEFEREWLSRVAGYTDYTTAGMAESRQDMCAFVNKWRPKILRHQVYMEPDPVKREKLADWAINAISENPIDGLYYVMLIPHEELVDRWVAYESIVNLPARIDGVDLQFKDGYATWPSREFEDLEMAAVIRRNLVWTQGQSDVYAIIETDDAAHFKPDTGIYSGSLLDFWLVHYRNGHFVSSQKIPTKDILWEPCIENAPFGRGYTLEFKSGKPVLINCITGEIVMMFQDAPRDGAGAGDGGGGDGSFCLSRPRPGGGSQGRDFARRPIEGGAVCRG